jgi:methyltransferase
VSLLRILLLLVALARLAELALARRNTRRLLAAGGYETGRGHYPLIVLLHAAWLLALLFGVPADAPPRWGWLALFLLLQLGRGSSPCRGRRWSAADPIAFCGTPTT